EGIVVKVGEKRNTQYTLNKDNLAKASVNIATNKDNSVSIAKADDINEDTRHSIFSKHANLLLNYLKTPSYGRVKCSYQLKLIDDYIPNETQYVPNEIKNQLYEQGKRFDKKLAAGTYARNIVQRLLIDLSYNSSRLEGNTYTQLDTQKLIEEGLTAEGKVNEETVMIMNHKEAILFLVENAEEIVLNSFLIRNIHHLLSQDLLKNPKACGNIRQVEVAIGKSTYLPLSNPHQLEEQLALLLRKAAQIINPFEQSFFLLIHLSYLQAFEDVNKRTARLACNIAFIKENLCPLSFIDVPQDDYFKALLYFYEKNEWQPALELFQWAYLKSCEQYDVVKESLGEIDTFRIQYRAIRKEAMGEVIRQGLTGEEIEIYLKMFCLQRTIEFSDKFITMTMGELKHLHSGAIVGLGITEKTFKAWKKTQ
ncbi:MAG: Fic family protein, partial [Alteromonadaceae bacterium]